MITSRFCRDCLKENVCKYKEEYENDKENVNGQVFSEVTNIHILCKEFLGKPNMREWGDD